MFNTKRKLHTTVFSSALAGVLLAATAIMESSSSPAVALGKASTSCSVSGGYKNNAIIGINSTCSKVQARIFRYSGGIQTFHGPEATYISVASSSIGIYAGGQVRGKLGSNYTIWKSI